MPQIEDPQIDRYILCFVIPLDCYIKEKLYFYHIIKFSESEVVGGVADAVVAVVAVSVANNSRRRTKKAKSQTKNKTKLEEMNNGTGVTIFCLCVNETFLHHLRKQFWKENSIKRDQTKII